MWKEFRPIILFIAKFFVVYILLTLIYSWYLQPYLYEQNITDPITAWMADVSAEMMRWFGFQAQTVQFENETYKRFFLDGEFASLVNEGCNAISVGIIFISFIIAFSNGILKTMGFVLGGIVLLLITNIIRIGLLTYIFRYFPEYSKSAHDYLFPAIIYGMVVILWFLWVHKFAFKK